MGAAERFACAAALAVFAGGALGLILERLLPDEFTTGGPRDMIGAVVGLLTLLSALVLGLLIWTAFGVYSGQNLAVQTLAVKVLQLDLALADYGPEANAGRALFRQDLAKTIDAIWNANLSDSEFAAHNLAGAIDNLRHREGLLKSLDPSTDRAEAGACGGPADGRFDRSIPAADVIRAFRRCFVPAGLYRGRLGGGALLRLRADVEGQCDELRRAGLRGPRGGQRRSISSSI